METGDHPPELNATVPLTGNDRPPFAVALNAALDERDIDKAFRICLQRLEVDPDNVEAYRHLGLLYAADGKRGAALAAAKRACEVAPDDPVCKSDLGRVYALLGDMMDAARCFTEAVGIDVRFAEGWHNLGTAYKKLGRRQEAFGALKNALIIDATRAETYLNLAGLLIDAGQFEDALEALERAAKHDPDLPQVRSRLANQLSQKGKVKRAETLFRQSLSMDPGHIEGWLGLGQALEDLGEAEGACSAYRNVLRRRPNHAKALGNFLSIVSKTESPVTDGVDWLDFAERALRNDKTSDEAKALVGYGLVKFHDRRNQIAAAAETGRLANAARRSVSGPLDREALAKRVDNIIATYTSDFFMDRRRLGLGNDQPVFIVGLPRSGTTLTEQILSAHPLLHGAGELPDLGRLATSVLGENEASWQAALLLNENRSRLLATDYLKALRDGTPKERLRISDKSPLNFFQLAFAALLFPNARVVHCRRDPRDNALSIWMQNFNPDQRYATDFSDLAFFHAQYSRLMDHWRENLPLQILDMPYEKTVSNLESQSRRLIDFLGVPWNKRCLEFHNNNRAVQTPSRWQVRQPIYTRAVGRWERYVEHLPDLETAFADLTP